MNKMCACFYYKVPLLFISCASKYIEIAIATGTPKTLILSPSYPTLEQSFPASCTLATFSSANYTFSNRGFGRGLPSDTWEHEGVRSKRRALLKCLLLFVRDLPVRSMHWCRSGLSSVPRWGQWATVGVPGVAAAMGGPRLSPPK